MPTPEPAPALSAERIARWSRMLEKLADDDPAPVTAGELRALLNVAKDAAAASGLVTCCVCGKEMEQRDAFVAGLKRPGEFVCGYACYIAVPLATTCAEPIAPGDRDEANAP